MKILSLRFKNLNSLYGEWRIDFTTDEYVTSGIFALTGPTGAGKSTILDAICLALYGATPRLGRITASGNEIMSRKTGECFAEVEFQSQEGMFRCHWGHHRARKKHDGDLQSPRHEIVEIESPGATGRVLEHKLSKVHTVVEAKTGMDFDRFTRSILLAQGGFDTFLKADTEQKSKILEQITGTEIYTTISKGVHERTREEKEALQLLQAETAGMTILTPEQEQLLEQELAKSRAEEQALLKRSEETARFITWRQTLARLEADLELLLKEESALAQEHHSFAPHRERLERALKAANFDGPYASLTALRSLQRQEENALAKALNALPALESSTQSQAQQLKQAEQARGIAKQALHDASPTLKRVRALDQDITTQRRTIAEHKGNCRIDAEAIATLEKSLSHEHENLATATRERATLQEYLTAHAHDALLVGALSGVLEQFAALEHLQELVHTRELSLRKATVEGERARALLTTQAKVTAQNREEVATSQKLLSEETDKLTSLLGGKSLRELRGEKEAHLREMVLHRRIAELEDHRQRLEDGKACPLCGALEHPFAQGNIPRPTETEAHIEALARVIGNAEELEAAITQRKEAVAASRTTLAESEKQEAAAHHAVHSLEKDLADLTRAMGETHTQLEATKRSISERLKPYGITALPDSDHSSLVAALKERVTTWNTLGTKKDQLDADHSRIREEIQRLEAIRTTKKSALQEKHLKLKTLTTNLETTQKERTALYGNKEPDREEARLQKALLASEQAENEARAKLSGLSQQLASAKSETEALKGRIGQRRIELGEVETEFDAAIRGAGFEGEQGFSGAHMSAQERETLNGRARALDNQKAALAARRKDHEARLTEELARALTELSSEELAVERNTIEESLTPLRESIASRNHLLSENMKTKERLAERAAVIETQRLECLRWERLHRLIGSADGKKYRTFAQGLTFEIMVSHANRQLTKMSDRYLLVRDDEQPLELNVMDNYQAGEIRSTRNLSGGESFIVSLTLALGLSKMASRKVRVDSLFLDEGFGTLDEESLDTALEALSGLQQENKLIGVISHVPALKERIGTQITITPLSGGKSALSGPGCAKIGS